ncbi:hypothetical protein R3P38DRAFT_3273949 [Favolaschia claudopus]|uniref:Uncharacterized protein n=1 Tax=Favolaschia claudopus TaxID=2862362 RepID=A0AAW0B0H0_9AGAR
MHATFRLPALTLKPPESSNQPFRRHPAATHPHRPTTTTKTHRRVGSNVIDDDPRTPHSLSSFPQHPTLSSAPSRRTAPFAPPPPPFAESTLKSTRTWYIPLETPSPLPVVTASPPPPRYQHCAGISRHPDTPKPKPTKPFSPSTSNDAAAAADVVHATLVNTDAEILTSALRASPRKLALERTMSTCRSPAAQSTNDDAATELDEERRAEAEGDLTCTGAALETHERTLPTPPPPPHRRFVTEAASPSSPLRPQLRLSTPRYPGIPGSPNPPAAQLLVTLGAHIVVGALRAPTRSECRGRIAPPSPSRTLPTTSLPSLATLFPTSPPPPSPTPSTPTTLQRPHATTDSKLS